MTYNYFVFSPLWTNVIIHIFHTPAPAVHLANVLACSGSKNTVMILKGGYERFSAEYPFLRTQKIMYTDVVSQNINYSTFTCINTVNTCLLFCPQVTPFVKINKKLRSCSTNQLFCRSFYHFPATQVKSFLCSSTLVTDTMRTMHPWTMT